MSHRINTDIAIVGGGIAGLWLLNRLRLRGYRAILLERDRLGCGQTGASQGMIHGGMKYAFGGLLTGASEAIAEMPSIWRDCLAGSGTLDLSDVEVLSDHYYLWSTSRAPSRLAAFLGSHLIRGRAERVATAELPPVFRNPSFKGSVYRLHDLVLDPQSLINSLYQKQRHHVLKSYPCSPHSIALNPDGSIAALQIEGGVTIKAKRYIFAAGAGNRALLELCNRHSPAMQRRPLHQVVVRHTYPHPLFAHSIDLLSGTKPRLTVTTHRAGDGRHIWYLGGELAESGVTLTEVDQIEHAKQELRETLPWVELTEASWKSLRIDRAEPAQEERERPDNHYVRAIQNLIVVWPVKLTLTPALSQEVEALIEAQSIQPSGAFEAEAPLPRSIPRAAPAIPIWNDLFD